MSSEISQATPASGSSGAPQHDQHAAESTADRLEPKASSVDAAHGDEPKAFSPSQPEALEHLKRDAAEFYRSRIVVAGTPPHNLSADSAAIEDGVDGGQTQLERLRQSLDGLKLDLRFDVHDLAGEQAVPLTYGAVVAEKESECLH